LFAFMWAHPGKQLLFMGGEFGQRDEWSEFGLDWHLPDSPPHSGVRRLVADLNRVYRSTPALHSRDTGPDGFSWVHVSDLVFAFLRHGDSGDVVACVANFAGVPRPEYRIGLPKSGRWRETVNTDGGDYGGSGVGNRGEVVAEDLPYHGQPASAVLTLPPMGVLWLVPDTYTDV
jgi:1,4-alpha-glucan branching enzyme